MGRGTNVRGGGCKWGKGKKAVGKLFEIEEGLSIRGIYTEERQNLVW